MSAEAVIDGMLVDLLEKSKIRKALLGHIDDLGIGEAKTLHSCG